MRTFTVAECDSEYTACSNGKAGSVSQCENLGGGHKLAYRFQPFLDQSSPGLGHAGESL